MRPASLATALLVALAALVGPGLAAQPAGAVAGRCEPGKGVTVVVDYGPLRSGIDLFCARDGGGQETAEIMRRAGVGFEYTAGQPFVCRIQGLPGADRESCSDTPPPDAYWGLFTSDGSSSWRYATQGASSQTVPNGGSVGWRFQDGGDRDNPGATPTPRPAPKPSPAQADGSGDSSASGSSGSASPTPQARSSATQSASASASASARSSATAASEKSTAADDKDKSKGSKPERRRKDSADRQSAPDASALTDSAAEPVEEVQPLSGTGDDTGSGGGLLPLLIGGLAVLGLGTYAALAARRRRV